MRTFKVGSLILGVFFSFSFYFLKVIDFLCFCLFETFFFPCFSLFQEIFLVYTDLRELPLLMLIRGMFSDGGDEIDHYEVKMILIKFDIERKF